MSDNIMKDIFGSLPKWVWVLYALSTIATACGVGALVYVAWHFIAKVW